MLYYQNYLFPMGQHETSKWPSRPLFYNLMQKTHGTGMGLRLKISLLCSPYKPGGYAQKNANG